MNQSIKKYIEVLLLIIVSAFFFVFAFRFFSTAFFESSGISSQFIGAFMGALFAFLFVRLSEGLTKFYERQLKHYNALVRLERQINIYLNVISNNIFVVDDFIGISEEIVANNKPAIYFNTLHEFTIDKDIGLDLHNLDLINQLFSFEVGIEKMNHSISSTNRFYSDIRVAFIEKNIDFDTYKTNIAILKDKLKELKKFLNGLEQECKELSATVRLLMRYKPFLTRLIHLFVKKRLSEKMKKEMPQEIKKLEEEIRVIQQESEKKISSILNSSK